jgi:hypothetical protein
MHENQAIWLFKQHCMHLNHPNTYTTRKYDILKGPT